MPPKGGNTKKESGRAKKAENEVKKADAAAQAKEKKEAADWEDGAKTKKAKDVEKEQKKAADAAKKAEVARLLAEEEAASSSPKPKVKLSSGAGKKKAAPPPPAGPGAIAAQSSSQPAEIPDTAETEEKDEPTEFSATGLDDALDMMSLVTEKKDKASVGAQAAMGTEQHPERRFKAAFEAYKEKELPELKVDRPGLRLQQYTEILYKQFQKSPENPFNQQTVAYNATQDEKVDALKKQKEITANRLAVRQK